MVILKYMDINKFLTKNDFHCYINRKLTWPWLKTHFIQSNKCVGCGKNENMATSGHRHFILIMNIPIAMALLKSLSFWCQYCGTYTIYEHYPEDECLYCHKNE